MRIQKIATLPALLLTLSNSVMAGVIPGFNALPGLGGVPVAALDYTFDQSGLNGTFTHSGTDWTLNVTGSGPSAFYIPGGATVYTVSGSTYSLVANFTSSGHLDTSVSNTLTVNGTLSGSTYPTGATAPTSSLLLSETLTGFGYSASQAAIGFTTQFQTSWADQGVFTGGSGGDVTYLFNQGGVSTGFGPLSGLIAEFASVAAGGSFTATSFTNVESLAAVPLPLSAILFGTGLTALMGIGRQRRNPSKALNRI